MGRVSFEHIGERARQLALKLHPIMADHRPGDIVVDIDLGDYWCRLFPDHGVYIVLCNPSRIILKYDAQDVAKVTPGFEDALREEVLPLLNQRLILDDLAEV